MTSPQSNVVVINGEARLSDIGVGQYIENLDDVRWMAPEVLELDSQYPVIADKDEDCMLQLYPGLSPKSDVYSFGMTALEVTPHLLFLTEISAYDCRCIRNANLTQRNGGVLDLSPRFSKD